MEYSKQLNSAKETPIPSPNVAHSAPPSPSPWCHAKRLASLHLHILTLWWTKCTSLQATDVDSDLLHHDTRLKKPQ